MNKVDLDRIRTTNEGDYIALVFAARMYTELKESGEDNAPREKALIRTITGLLDKYEVKYQNDLC